MTATAPAKPPAAAAPPVVRCAVTLLPTGWGRFDNAPRIPVLSSTSK